ncbi:MAG TPA: hypothetical protein PK723_04895 [Candidatus Pacearchaeota archaeon]|nr:hypothetical protein [Candidatus Pacearchaeota archaeon]
MKKTNYILILFFLLLTLLSCTTKLNMSPDEEIIGKEPLITLDSINDLNSINNENSLYIIRLLTDEDTLNLLIELKNYIDPILNSNKKSVNRRLVYNKLLEICNKYQEVPEKLESMINSSEKLTTQRGFQAEIIEAAKDDVLKSLNSLYYIQEVPENPSILVIDYRDLIYLRSVATLILSIYEGKDIINNWLETLELVDLNGFQTYFLKEEAQYYIENFDNYLEDTYLTGNYPWKYEETWHRLDETVKQLACISSPENLLTTEDLFKESTLIIDGMSFFIEKADFFAESFYQIYLFESQITDSEGWTNDDKTSLYEYARLNGKDDISVKTILNTPISNLELPKEIVELRIGKVDLLNSPTKADLLEVISEALPNNKLEITTIYSKEIKNWIIKTVTKIYGSLTLDFKEMSMEPLNLNNNNLGAKQVIIEKSFIDTKMWKYFEKGEIRSDDAEKILKIILENLTFGNPNEYSIYINLDESIKINIDIDVN